MPVHLMCVTSGGGLPVFNRNSGNVENLPFSVIGSLNGVHMFGKSQYLELLSTITENYSVVWKEFHDSVVLIAIASNCTKAVLNKLLQSVFNAMVLIVGIEEIKSQRNIERLKRELRVGYPVIDRLLDGLDTGDANMKHSSDLVGMTECILCPENHLLQIILDSYTECVDSMFSCLLVHGKICVATENWWSLHPDEIKLLALVATAENTSTSKDIPVFLPIRSPNVAFRFVAISLAPEVQICSLCGPTPSLEEIEHSATQCFKTHNETLNSAALNSPKNIPLNINLENGILGILLVDFEQGKYVFSKYPQQLSGAKRPSGSSHRLDILRTFFYQAVLGTLIKMDEEKVKNDNEMLCCEFYDNSEEAAVQCLETFWCSEYHKCHAIRIQNNVICVLYNSSIPNHAMRLISEKTCKLLVSDKQVCW